MAFQISDACANALLDALETTVGASPVMRIRSGVPPANVAAADTGAVLATATLPADWMTNAAARVKALSGLWQDAAADAAGTAGHFRLYASNGTTAHWQGTVTATGGGGDMTVDNVNFAAGQQFTVTSFSLTAPNA